MPVCALICVCTFECLLRVCVWGLHDYGNLSSRVYFMLVFLQDLFLEEMRTAQLSCPFLEKVPLIWFNIRFLVRELKVLGSVPQGVNRLLLSLHKGTWGPVARRAGGSPLDISMGPLCLTVVLGVVPAPDRCLDVTGSICLPFLESGAWHLQVLPAGLQMRKSDV